jgi:hypothetical protein
MRRRWISTLVTIGLAATAAGIVAVPASAEMRSKLISRHLCKTIGGGRFVDIPHFPGERIDRRLLADIRWMRHRYEIFITDGYSTDPVHAPNGEHPIGLALDIVPNKAAGGTWNLIGDLAHRAEPRQNEPRPPWRWVGWNGDPGHGRGHHLHLSWMHSETEPRDPARVVYTRKCPVPPEESTERRRRRSTGGTAAGEPSGSSSTGGISPKRLDRIQSKMAPPVPEA